MGEEETKENTESLKAQLTKRLHDWLERVGPGMTTDITMMNHASIKFSIFNGDAGSLSDDTPCICARVEEKLSNDEIDGWLPHP